MNQGLYEVFERNKDEYLKHLKNIVAIDTQVIGHGIDGGNEKNGQEYIEKLFKELGADEIKKETIDESIIKDSVDKYSEGNIGHNYEKRYNLIGKFKGDPNGKSLLFNGHIDTMPPGDLNKWVTNPFTPTLKDGKLYGLGTADMKSGLMASIMAIKLLKDSGYNLPGDVTITSVIDEEGGGNGTLATVLKGYKEDAAVVCEPSNKNLIVAHMGFIFFKVEVEGVSLHSGSKWKGINAIEKAIILIEALQDLEHQWLMKYKHPLLPPPTLNIGVIEGGTAGSTVPDYCSFNLCLHYLPNVMDHRNIVEEITDALMLRAMGDKWLESHPPKISIYQAGGAFEMDKSSPFVRVARESMEEIVKDVDCIGSTAGNDARLLHNIGNMPTVIMGPGYLEQCHSPNEYVSLEQYFKFVKIYTNLILKWCSK